MINRCIKFSLGATTLLGMLLLFATSLSAQNTSLPIKGKVVDSKMLSLPGATVLIKGQSTGTATDGDGSFTINVKEGDELEVSFVGFIAQSIKITKSTKDLEIVLQEDATVLGEAVVIGYGSVVKKDMTGSVESIKGATLEKTMLTDVTQALGGRVSGVNVVRSSNRPGADIKLEIRGVNSFNSDNDPLYVINGVPSYSGMRHLNPSDIESIEVLKDASSSAIFGSRGANGVVIITTKGASKKEGYEVNYHGWVGYKTAARIPDMIGSKGKGLDYVDYRTTLWTNKYGASSLSRPDFLTAAEKERIRNGQYYDMAREVIKSGIVNNQNVSVSGGSEKTSYTFGLGYMNEEGIVGKEQFTRMTANIGLEHRFSNYLKIGMSSYAAMVKINQGSSEALINAFFIPPIVSPYNSDGSLLFNVQPTSSKVNPLVDIENQKRQRNEKFVNVAGFMEVTPLEWLSLKTQIATQYNPYEAGEYIGTFTQAKKGVNPAEAFKSSGSSFNWVWDNIMTIKKEFNNQHKLHFIGLFSAQKDTHESSEMRGDGLPYNSDWHAIQTADEIRDVKSNYWESSMLSYMGRLNYTLLDKYLFTVSARYDGTSRLGQGNQWGLMPSAAVGWQLKNEGFMQDVKFVDELKLRVSYGYTGNNNVRHDVTWTRLDMLRYNYGDKGVNGFGIGNVIGNKDLKWEMTSELNWGLDFGLFNKRITGTLDIYKRTTKDLIFERKFATLNGFTSRLENIGTTSNQGFEISLNTLNVRHTDFTWRSTFTFSLNRNKIVDLDGTKSDDVAQRWFIGQPIKVQYDYNFLGIWQEEERAEAAKYGKAPGHIKVADHNTDYNLDERDMQVLGTPSPDFITGMNNTFTYKNLDFSFDLYARVGGLYNDPFTYTFTAWDNEHWNKLNVNYWTPENRSNEYPGIGAVSLHTQVLSYVSGSFLKVQNITLGYTFTKLADKWKIKNIRVYGNVQNPFTFTSYLGSDPESIGENIYSNLSIMPMTFAVGLNITL